MRQNNNISRLMRNWHRDLGYFAVAVSLVYGLSGIFLSHKEAFPVISTIKNETTFPSEMTIASFSEQWETCVPDFTLNKCFVAGNTIKFYFEGGRGVYNMESGLVSFESYKNHSLIRFVNQLHLNQVKGWKYMANFFSVCLIFLALSGLVLVKGKNGFKKRGVWIMLAGFVSVMIFLFL